MRFLRLSLHEFRNIAFAELDLSADRVFLLGPNAQGKSNLLEALGLITALRSFRTQGGAALPREGAAGYAALYLVEHEVQGRTEVELRGGPGGREVAVDGERVRRMGDFIGRFPVVPLHGGDLMLLRGGPAERRRFLDLTLSATDPAYYGALRRYHRGVAERNRLLKRGGGGGAELEAFEAEIAPAAVALETARRAGAEALEAALKRAYATIAETDEGPELRLAASAPCESAEAVRAMLRDDRRRDAATGSTRRGPHRDDLRLILRGGAARDYASDGQQRGLCVALRLAQAAYFEYRLGLRPALLADDVLGELDPRRRAGFWRACPPAAQVIASGTEAPEDAEEWSVWRVGSGRFARA